MLEAEVFLSLLEKNIAETEADLEEKGSGGGKKEQGRRERKKRELGFDLKWF